MTTFTINQEATSPVAASRLFKALALERHIIVPKLMPQAFKSVEIVEGNGGVGTITKVTFPEGAPFTYMLQRIDELDIENRYCKYTIFEGEMLQNLESITHEAIFEPSGEGCIARMTSHHHPKPGTVVNEAGVKIGQEKAHVLFKKVEEYLISNPDVCV